MCVDAGQTRPKQPPAMGEEDARGTIEANTVTGETRPQSSSAPPFLVQNVEHARAPGKLTQFIVSRDRSTTSVTAEQDDFYESLSPLLTFHVKRDFFSRGECKKAHPCGKGFQKGDRSTRTATISHRDGHDGRHKRCGEDCVPPTLGYSRVPLPLIAQPSISALTA